MYACVCKGITEAEARREIAGLTSEEEVVERLGLDDGGCCGRCRRTICAFFCQKADERTRPGCARSRWSQLLDAAAVAVPSR